MATGDRTSLLGVAFGGVALVGVFLLVRAGALLNMAL